ncbi:MMPL family transporter, partial [Marinitenerispora sediminis]
GADGVAEAYSYWTRDASPVLRSEDGTQAVLLARLPGDADTVRREVLPELGPDFTRDTAAYTVRVGGGEQVFLEASGQAAADFLRAEAIIFPMVFLLLLVVLRNAVLAVLPLLVGLFTIAGTLAVLRGVTLFAEISTFALNITLVMGIALAVDYCLFLIFRFREELAAGRTVPDAVAATVRTAGRTVLFSGGTVVASLSVLFALPFDFLRSFAYAGIAVVLLAVAGSVLLLPAALALLGPRASRRLFGARRASGAGAAVDPGSALWSRTARRVMRRPLAYGAAAVVVLAVLGSPVFSLRFGLPDDRVLPESAPSRQVQQDIRDGFTAEQSDALLVVAPDAGPAAADRAALASYAAELSRIDGVAQVDGAAGSFAGGELVTVPAASAERFAGDGATWLSVVPTVERLETDPFGLVAEVRGLAAPFDVEVGGYPADLVDYRDSLVDRLPLLLLLVLAVTFVILFLLTGSVVVPLKATVLNLLSLSVMFGALVWVFQLGNLSGLLGFTATGSLESSIPILMFCVGYGLSMDYEVFMLARVKEEYDRTGDTATAVAEGLRRSGPLITAAGAILALSFAAYATSEVVFLKMLGVGLALAVLVDATLIRAILVPAIMRLAGDLNWWAPAPLRRLHARVGISESDEAPRSAAPARTG